jgi:tripartite-type tricarboxylate transporter receptor subunit TctC
MAQARRRFLELAAGAAALPLLHRIACAQAYPTRPVRLIVGFPAGGVGDVLARLMGQWLSDRLGQPFVIENRPGAATNIATEAVVRGPGVMEINPAVPAKSIPEFIAHVKANPGKINLASSGPGTVSHVAGELFKMMAGVDMVHVPYRGAAPALTDLVSGQVQVMILPIISSLEHIKAGRLRALGVTTATRLEVVPDVPTVAEYLPGYEVSDWTGIGVPRGTPVEIVDRFNAEINAALADPKIKARLAELGSQLMPMSRAAFAQLIVDETEKWAKVAKTAGIKAE